MKIISKKEAKNESLSDSPVKEAEPDLWSGLKKILDSYKQDILENNYLEISNYLFIIYQILLLALKDVSVMNIFLHLFILLHIYIINQF